MAGENGSVIPKPKGSSTKVGSNVHWFSEKPCTHCKSYNLWRRGWNSNPGSSVNGAKIGYCELMVSRPELRRA